MCDECCCTADFVPTAEHRRNIDKTLQEVAVLLFSERQYQVRSGIADRRRVGLGCNTVLINSNTVAAKNMKLYLKLHIMCLLQLPFGTLSS